MAASDLPTVQNIEWLNNDIDLFTLSQLEQAHINHLGTLNEQQSFDVCISI